jgi:chromosome segregation ATPase
MKYLIFLTGLLATNQIYGQIGESKGPSLTQRYQNMKSSSQTYKEYKVIKEVVLDNEWKTAEDSVRAIRTKWGEAKSTIGQLEGDLSTVRMTLKQKEDATAKIEHAANHIDFFGMDFRKPVFIITVLLIFAGLAAVLGLMTGRLKMLFKVMREKNEFLDRITAEFEEYKHKALEKQTKLSRELQTERNKLQDLRRV